MSLLHKVYFFSGDGKKQDGSIQGFYGTVKVSRFEEMHKLDERVTNHVKNEFNYSQVHLKAFNRI